MEALLHLVPRADWESAGDPYAPASLATEGFVHLCTPAQAAGVARRFFAGRDDLLVLVLDPARLPPLRWEDSYGHGLFPHACGPIPRAAVAAVRPFQAGDLH